MQEVWKLLLFGGDKVLFSFQLFKYFSELFSISWDILCNGAKYGSLNLKLVWVPFNEVGATEPALFFLVIDIFWVDKDFGNLLYIFFCLN